MTQLYDLDIILTLTEPRPHSNIHIYFADPMKLSLTLQFYDIRPTCDLPPVGVMAVASFGDQECVLNS